MKPFATLVAGLMIGLATPSGVQADPGAQFTGVLHIMGYGQSLSIGAMGMPPLSTQPRAGTFMFQTGIVRQDDKAGSYDAFVPLRETQRGNVGETGIAAAAGAFLDRLGARTPGEEAAPPLTVLGSSSGVGGTGLPWLARGMPAYAVWKRMVAGGRDAARARGQPYAYLATLWAHGESDQVSGTPRLAYVAGLRRLKDDMAADAMAISGQPWRPFFLANQPASHLANAKLYKSPLRPNMALALGDACAADAEIICVEPLYFGDFRDGIHPDGRTYEQIGRYYGRALALLTEARRRGVAPPTLSVRLREAAWDGASVALRFSVPAGRLVFDTTQVKASPNMGFDLWSPDGALLPDGVKRVALTSDDTVRVEFTAPPPQGARLTYAFGRTENFGKGGRIDGPRGNLRDSAGDTDSYVLAGQHRRLDNWAFIFEAVKP